ncbi:NfeD family protein [uncultured Pseudokineococcus sp.]|uniref:NfeD family protein n=1 Tax=uncultured Pseudokineococcus sp. TaxID=1642928 RepID=UPI0026048919|nr:NfeD family protein [uncultured Pseudokineococcus sp.]
MGGLEDLQWLLWVGLALLLGAVEVASLDLVFGMVAAAALVAALSAALGLSLPLQVITFAVAAFVLLALARPAVLRYVRPHLPLVATNADANVGQRAEVLEQVTARDGRVKLRGEVWSARTESGDVLLAGADVEVVRIDGATAVVRALPPADPPGRPAPGTSPSGPDPSPSPWSPS